MRIEICFMLLFSLCISASGKLVILTRQSDDCMYGSNVVRNVHGVAVLKYDQHLNGDAEDWAIRLALNGSFQHSGERRGENLYMSYGKSVVCPNVLFSWYQGIKKFDYDHPKWTYQDGTFIQLVYDKVKSSGFGTAAYNGKVFAVGLYDYVILTSDPMDSSHVPKPSKEITKKDLTPKKTNTVYISIPIPPSNQVWTQWVNISQCSAICGEGTITEERWCVHGDYSKDCVGERKRTVPCKTSDQGCCLDHHKDCKAYAMEKQYCTSKLYKAWMDENCPKSCGICKASCIDKHKDCKAYAMEKQYCTSKLYKAWMDVNCPKSCGICKASCIDKHNDCKAYAMEKQYCTSKLYKAWMDKNCPKSCGICKASCIDNHKDCKVYAMEKQYCTSKLYKAWMDENCPKSCGKCKAQSANLQQMDVSKKVAIDW